VPLGPRGLPPLIVSVNTQLVKTPSTAQEEHSRAKRTA
jgi:hypothetical protein